MEQQNEKRTRIIGLRLTAKEYELAEKRWKGSTCRKLSDYLRRCLFNKPVVTTVRNKSQDDLMAEAIQLKIELNRVGNNFNQAIKKLHTLQHIPEFHHWLVTYDQDKNRLLEMVGQIKDCVQKMGEQWLQ